jgi:hypothetical protein
LFLVLSVFSTVAHEFKKEKVVFNGQSREDLTEEINEVSPPSSSSCSPHSQTGARTVQQEELEEENEKEGEESLLSPKVEPIESDDEEGDNLTTEQTNSPQPPVNGPYFFIAESDFFIAESEEEETVDEGSLPVMNVAN